MLATLLVAFFVVLAFGGYFGCVVAAGKAESWLAANDPDFEPSSLWGRGALVRGVFMRREGIKPMLRYREVRSARGEPTTLVTVFWLCFAAWIAWPFALIAIAAMP